MNESELIENFKKDKSEESFIKLIDFYKDYLIKFIAIKTQRTSLDPNEIFSKTLMKVWVKIDSFKGDGQFKNWLFKITKNIIFDEFESLKKFNPNPALLEESFEVECSSPSPDEEFSEKEYKALILSRIEMVKKSLSQKHQRVFELIFEQGKSYRETSEILKCSVGTVMSRVHYTRRKMQEVFNKYEYRNFN